MELDDYMTERAICRVLARMRMRIADERHADDLYWQVAKGAPDPVKRHDGRGNAQTSVCACMPPRRKWGRSTRKMRPYMQYNRMLESGILYAIRRQRENGGLLTCDWGRSLQSLIDDVTGRVTKGVFCFQKPKIVAIPKSATEYRCLAQYENLSDRLILAQTARYVRDQFDELLSPNSYAFRRSGEISHVTAIRKLRDYRCRQGSV